MSTGSTRCGLGVAAVATVVFVLGLAPSPAGADTVEATVMNDSLADDGECSVREAVEAANTNANVFGANDCAHDGTGGPDTVKLPGGTAAISGAAGEDDNATGDLDLTDADGLMIEGKGKASTKLDGDVDRVIHELGGRLTLRDLTVQDGDAGSSQEATCWRTQTSLSGSRTS